MWRVRGRLTGLPVTTRTRVGGCDTVAPVSTVTASRVRAEFVRALEVDLMGQPRLPVPRRGQL